LLRLHEQSCNTPNQGTEHVLKTALYSSSSKHKQHAQVLTGSADIHSPCGIQALSEASLEDVNAMWAGLGYYRRARFLLEGAQYVMQHHNGSFPRTSKELQKIPGDLPPLDALQSYVLYRPQKYAWIRSLNISVHPSDGWPLEAQRMHQCSLQLVEHT
jgi:hypothetical protein